MASSNHLMLVGKMGTRASGRSSSLAVIPVLNRSYSASSKYPDKVLVANRGEIACRVMATARKLGVKTVAVYSDADINSMHVQMADEAYRIGEAPSNQSYLRMKKIIEVAKVSGAEAIHPGYGFLSENKDFAQLCQDEGVSFVGPPSGAIESMGIKSRSKEIMIEAGVPVVPGYHGDDQSVERLKAEAKKMGYPVLIKAVLGGGGKGMRIVDKEEDFEDMLDSARRESLNHFSDDNVLVEKFVTRPRHVEVQVFADGHGEAVYLFERDCSVQRRHQKIIEEAPAPGISEELRRELGETAVRAAKAVGYVGAGTVEFILDTRDLSFYFMEMNTRLQVEHPITEMITGTDLVEWQLLAAAGGHLPVAQDDLKINGHSFEARIYAENPESDFLPGTGPLLYMKTPEASDVVRVETGVRQGDEVSVHYDPMIAKLVVWGQDRSSALALMRQKLREYRIAGLKTNINFLGDLAAHPEFVAANVSTDFLEDFKDDLFGGSVGAVPPHVLVQAAVGKHLLACGATGGKDPWSTCSSFRVNGTHSVCNKFLVSDVEVEVTLADLGGGRFQAELSGGLSLNVEAELAADGETLKARIEDRQYSSAVVEVADSVHVFGEDGHFEMEAIFPEFLSMQTSAESLDVVLTPMTGKIVKVMVKAGENVEEGTPVIAMEAMKMEHILRAPYNGKVLSTHCTEGDLVDEGVAVVRFQSETDEE